MLKLPNFVVIGAPKSGTTSLFYYLKQHPQIFLPTRKELHYFAYPLLAEHACGPGDKETLSSLCSTKDEYEKHYENVALESAVGEISPSYLYYADYAAPRISQELGRVKIIAIVRDPVEKAYSQFMHLIRDRRETLEFYDALQEESARRSAGWSDIWRYAESSLYAARLERYITTFGAENVRVIPFAELTENPQSVLKDLFRFLDVDENFVSDTDRVYNRTGNSRSNLVSDFFARPNPLKSLVKRAVPESIRIPVRLAILNWNTGKKDAMDPRAREYLVKYFKDDVARVDQILARTG